MSSLFPGGAQPVLHGRAILVTRPVAQAVRLCQQLAAAGAEAVPFPTLEILSTWKDRASDSELSRINMIKHDIAVFISPTAVLQGLAALAAGGVTAANWPPGLAIAAVGRGTAAELARQGFAEVMVPGDGADSAALAALPAFQPAAIAAKSILIVCGEGGREWLADTLRARGARVTVAVCYRRVMPQGDAAPAVALSGASSFASSGTASARSVVALSAASLAARWSAGGIAAATVHSRGALDNLLAMLPATLRPRVMATPLFVAHPRIGAHARALGLREVHVAGPGDAEMIAGITAFFAKVAP